MTDPKNHPKPSPLAGFNWAESVKKAEQQGTGAKAEPAPTKPGAPVKAAHVSGAPKPNKGGGGKAQQRLRVKV